jgi:hypothetical protein
LETIEDNESFRVGLAGDLVVFYHFAPMTAVTVEQVRQVFDRMVATKSRFANLVVMQEGLPAPSSEFRDGMIRVVRERADHVAGLALIIQGKGFGAAALRAALAGMTLLARTRYPIKAFATVSEGTRWLSGILQISSDTAAASLREIETFIYRK